jgi:hypothetical protein
MLSKLYALSIEEMNSRGQGACFELYACLVFVLEQVWNML